MQKRLIFPLTMFVLAGLSFAYGTWQWLSARAVQASADARVAYIMGTVQTHPWSEYQKQAFYVALFQDYPGSPKVLGIDVSGSFASERANDRCVNAGQRAVCRSLRTASASAETIAAVCGACNPISP